MYWPHWGTTSRLLVQQHHRLSLSCFQCHFHSHWPLRTQLSHQKRQKVKGYYLRCRLCSLLLPQGTQPPETRSNRLRLPEPPQKLGRRRGVRSDSREEECFEKCEAHFSGRRNSGFRQRIHAGRHNIRQGHFQQRNRRHSSFHGILQSSSFFWVAEEWDRLWLHSSKRRTKHQKVPLDHKWSQS